MAHRIPSHPATPVRRAVLTDWPQGLGVASISRRSSAVAGAWPGQTCANVPILDTLCSQALTIGGVPPAI